jgi:hypothetical protein
MNPLSGVPLVLVLHAAFCVPAHLCATTVSDLGQDHAVPAAVALWKSTGAQHVYGFPDMKPKKKGTLTLSADALTFSGKSGNTSIQRSAVTAVSAGNQRVELWGMSGRILRMAIPNGGGLAAAAVMHHRVDMLTVEFNDGRGGNHAAVFLLPANEAQRALQNFALSPAPAQNTSDTVCQNAPVDSRAVLVSAPDWNQAEVPAAYRALVYEHTIDRLRSTKEVGHVYRDGEAKRPDACPQYIVHVSIATFKEGSSVERAYLGPAGLFVGTTQMKFDVNFSDAAGKLNVKEQITATMRGESESTNVADHVAKSLARRYAIAVKNAEKDNAPKKTVTPAS